MNDENWIKLKSKEQSVTLKQAWLTYKKRALEQLNLIKKKINKKNIGELFILGLLEDFWHNTEFIFHLGKSSKWKSICHHPARAIADIYLKLLYLKEKDETFRSGAGIEEAKKDLATWRDFSENSNNKTFTTHIDKQVDELNKLASINKKDFRDFDNAKVRSEFLETTTTGYDKKNYYFYKLQSQSVHSSFLFNGLLNSDPNENYKITLIMIASIMAEVMQLTDDFFALDKAKTQKVISSLNDYINKKGSK